MEQKEQEPEVNEFLSEHVNPESVTSFVDNSARDNVIMQYEQAADEAEKDDCAEQDGLDDILPRLARLRIFSTIVANLNRGGTAKLRSEEEVNAAPFFTEDLDAIERFLKEEAGQSYSIAEAAAFDPMETVISKSQQRRLSAQISHRIFVEQHRELK